jgi:hypothetical protein
MSVRRILYDGFFLTATPQRLQNPLRDSDLADSLVNWCDLATNCGIFYSRINLKLQVMALKTHIILNLWSSKIRKKWHKLIFNTNLRQK